MKDKISFLSAYTSSISSQ